MQQGHFWNRVLLSNLHYNFCVKLKHGVNIFTPLFFCFYISIEPFIAFVTFLTNISPGKLNWRRYVCRLTLLLRAYTPRGASPSMQHPRYLNVVDRRIFNLMAKIACKGFGWKRILPLLLRFRLFPQLLSILNNFCFETTSSNIYSGFQFLIHVKKKVPKAKKNNPTSHLFPQSQARHCLRTAPPLPTPLLSPSSLDPDALSHSLQTAAEARTQDPAGTDGFRRGGWRHLGDAAAQARPAGKGSRVSSPRWRWPLSLDPPLLTLTWNPSWLCYRKP